MGDKNVNYTKAQTATLVSDYQAATTEDERQQVVENHAAKLGKSVPSVRSKLVREGVYIAKSRAPAGKGGGEKKADIVADIASYLGVSEETVESLEKATKKALFLIRGGLESEAELPDSE